MGDAPQFPYSELPLTQEKRVRLIFALAELQASRFTAHDLFKFSEMYAKRTGSDDKWLVELAYRNGVYS